MRVCMCVCYVCKRERESLRVSECLNACECVCYVCKRESLRV